MCGPVIGARSDVCALRRSGAWHMRVCAARTRPQLMWQLNVSEHSRGTELGRKRPVRSTFRDEQVKLEGEGPATAGWPWRHCIIIQQNTPNSKHVRKYLALVDEGGNYPFTKSEVPRAPVRLGPIMQVHGANKRRPHVVLHCHPARGSLRTDIRI